MTGNLTSMQTEFVVDASVSIKWLNQDREDLTAQAQDILLKAEEEKIFLFAPDLLVHEVLNVLIRAKGLRGKQLEDAVDEFWQLPLSFFSTDRVLSSIASVIASQTGMSFYDAAYVALALNNQQPLITNNSKDQQAVSEVKVIPLSAWALD